MLAVLLGMRRNFEDAEMHHREALKAKLEQLGPLHPSKQSSHMNLGMLYKEIGRLEEAAIELDLDLAMALGPRSTITQLAEEELQQIRLILETQARDFILEIDDAVTHATTNNETEAVSTSTTELPALSPKIEDVTADRITMLAKLSKAFFNDQFQNNIKCR